jgi:hypothetical protein
MTLRVARELRRHTDAKLRAGQDEFVKYRHVTKREDLMEVTRTMMTCALSAPHFRKNCHLTTSLQPLRPNCRPVEKADLARGHLAT